MHALLTTPDHQLTTTLIDFPTGQASHLDWFYKHLECRCITHVRPMPGSLLATISANIDCWGDDEGLMVDEPRLNGTIMAATGYPEPLVGNWIITFSAGPNTIALPQDILQEITRYLSLEPSDTSVG